jgi:mucin-6/19
MRILNPAKLVLSVTAIVLLVLLGLATAARAAEPTPPAAPSPAAEVASAVAPNDNPGSSAATETAGSQPPAPGSPGGPSSAPNEAGTPNPGSQPDVPSPAPNEAATPNPGSQPATQPQPAVSGRQSLGTTSSPSQAPHASTTSISEAVQEAILQATTRQPDRSGVSESPLAAESNATSQLIWQVQISECTAHCRGLSQTQTAEQQNKTLQTLEGAPPAATEHSEQATGERSQTATSITQIQLGCLSHCFGTTTTTGTTILAAYRKVLEELLGEIVAGLSSLSPTSAAEQNTVEQNSYQSQTGQGLALTQTQSASQASTTVQVDDRSSSLIAELETALGSSETASDEAVNQTEQGIWQLQVGCLISCEETQQYQQAEQSNTTVQTVTPASQSASTTTASVANTAAQLIWQAQVGCLFWCFDTTQQQTAVSHNTLLVSASEGPSTPPPPGTTSTPPGTTSTPPGTGAEPTPPAPSAGSPSSSSGAGSSDPTSAASTPSAAPALLPIQPAVALLVTSTSISGKRRVGAPPWHRAARVDASPNLRRELSVRPALLTTRANVRGGAVSPGAARRVQPAFGSPAAGMALGSGERAGLSVPAVALLAALALCGLCLLRIRAVRT